MLPEGIKETPWDANPLGMDTYEVNMLSPEVFNFVNTHFGHYTLKIDPLYPTKDFLKLGFYYCDTMVEPYCSLEKFVRYEHDRVSLSLTEKTDEIESLVQNVFVHSRFSRDLNISKTLVNQRYLQWLTDLDRKGKIFKFKYDNEFAGFVACNENSLVLHALSEKYRGRGLSKFFWTLICNYLFEQGHTELKSSISMSNVSVLNLYCSLGFRFRHVRDVYHCFREKS